MSEKFFKDRTGEAVVLSGDARNDIRYLEVFLSPFSSAQDILLHIVYS